MTFDYQKYFKQIKPKTKLEIYNRFLFAFLSVHTSWQTNCRAYQIMKNKYWDSKEKLISILKIAKSGLYNNRAEYISEFTVKYLDNPKWYLKRRKETWYDYRNRLMKDIKGLGHAKSSFAIELIYPNSCWVTCIDTHIFQKFGYRQEGASLAMYDTLERLYINEAKQLKKHPVEYRWSYWDNVQNQSDCRYWSYVLE